MDNNCSIPFPIFFFQETQFKDYSNNWPYLNSIAFLLGCSVILRNCSDLTYDYFFNLHLVFIFQLNFFTVAIKITPTKQKNLAAPRHFVQLQAYIQICLFFLLQVQYLKWTVNFLETYKNNNNPSLCLCFMHFLNYYNHASNVRNISKKLTRWVIYQ